MAVKLTDFVNIHITREEVISNGKNKAVAYLSDIVKPDKNNPDNLYFSLKQILEAEELETTNKLYGVNTDVYKACKVFFDHGGKAIKLINVNIPNKQQSESINAYKTAVRNLPLDIIAFAPKYGTVVTGGTEESPTSIYNGGLLPADQHHIVEELEKIEMENGTAFRKMVAFDTTLLSAPEGHNKSNNAMYKYVESTSGVAKEEYINSCMGILAHLSRIDLNNPATISDYCFTKELGIPVVANTEELTWQKIGKNSNVVLDIFGGVPTNFGGNTGGGTDLVEEYMLITIAQDILKTELNLLTSKIKGVDAVASVNSALIRTLELYTALGFLTTGVYNGEDIVVNKNGVNIKVIGKGQIIKGGYFINILPMNSRTVTEVANRNLPDVHFIFNTAKGIRYINNVGRLV